MEINVDPTKETLAKYGYTLFVEKLAPQRFLIKTPKRDLEPYYPAREITLSVVDGELRWIENGAVVHSANINLYGVRVLIYFVLSIICVKLKYSTTCVFYKNGEKSVDSLIALMPTLDINQIEKEARLTEIVTAYLGGNIVLEELEQQAREHGVLTVFKAILSTEKLF